MVVLLKKSYPTYSVNFDLTTLALNHIFSPFVFDCNSGVIRSLGGRVTEDCVCACLYMLCVCLRERGRKRGGDGGRVEECVFILCVEVGLS